MNFKKTSLCILVFVALVCTASMNTVHANTADAALHVEHSGAEHLLSPPQRVACLYAFTGHTVVMLNKAESIVAVVRGLKRDKLLARVFPGLKNIAVPAKGGEINIEALLKTQPDIVFLKPETALIEGEIAKLERFHIPYYVAGYRSMEEQMTVIEHIGRLLDASQKAAEYIKYYRHTIERVAKQASTIADEKRITLYHAINEANRTTGPNTLESEWTAVTGVINVSVKAKLKHKGDKNFASMEQILLWNPAVIIANEDAVKKEILHSKKWSQIDAVKNKRVYTIPTGISRWGHPGGLETPLAIVWTAKTLYPELYNDINVRQEIRFFYKKFFDLSLSEKDIDTILSGKGMRQKKSE